MPFRTRIHESYVQICWYGVLVPEDLRALSRELPRIGLQLGRAPNVLHTFDEVEESTLNFESVHGYVTEVGRIRLPNRCRAASVSSSPTGFGIGRMFQAMNVNPDIEIQVFDRQEEAIRWLGGADE